MMPSSYVNECIKSETYYTNTGKQTRLNSAGTLLHFELYY